MQSKGFRCIPKMVFRKPVPTTVISILAFNKIDVTRIYDNLVTVFEMYTFGLNHIFSIDESGFSYVQKPASINQLLKMV
jgi:hypothetical protein